MSLERPSLSITGVGSTGPTVDDPRSIPELVLEAVDRALEDAGCTHDDIDAIVTASVDLYDGLTASSLAITEVVGAVLKPETRIAGDGLAALIHAACQIWAGAYETVLVVAHGKASLAPQAVLTPWAMDPIHLQPLGVDFLACAGLQARVLAEGDSSAMARWAQAATERHARAGRQVQVAETEPVATPLLAGMCAPPADGAVAVVVRGGDRPGAVRVTGIGHDLAPHALGDRDLTCWAGLERALARAARVAGRDADAPYDLHEPSCRHPHEEELFARAVPGPVAGSPTGGLFAGDVPIAAGLGRLEAAVLRLRERTEAGCALVHGTWGPAGQAQVVAVLERGP